ncbi:hypothetical protein [Paraburkholderia aromaticivorans]|uniref:hypothetical protein n=1 Tax=Paraburkholderia aromaticivorans TaxID=2026199 RepID=UPI00145611F8|nr:hypothetical protein [Paraburkholderia aromaticivorans]
MSNSYLDVRAAFALAKIASIVDPDDDSFAIAMADAQSLGYRDAENSPTAAPLMPVFSADEPNLADAWKEGVNSNEAGFETSSMCSFCFRNHEIRDCPHL